VRALELAKSIGSTIVGTVGRDGGFVSHPTLQIAAAKWESTR